MLHPYLSEVKTLLETRSVLEQHQHTFSPKYNAENNHNQRESREL